MTVSKISSLILDMDGVLWREFTPIGDLSAIFKYIHKSKLAYVLATNNATRTPDQFVEKLAGFGVKISTDKVITSGMGVAYLLSKLHPQGGPVYLVGEIGLEKAMLEAGFYPSQKNCLAVIAGMDRTISFEKLRAATLLIRSGVPFYGTNPDRTFPTPEGLIPGAGSILAALETSTDVKPIIAGKPNPTLYQFALDKLGSTPGQTLAVGDRIETDILGAQRLGCKTALVLSGVSTREQAEAHLPRIDFISPCLGDLLGSVFGK